MGLRDLLRKKDHVGDSDTYPQTVHALDRPEFQFIRSDTLSQEVIHAPSAPASPLDSSASSNPFGPPRPSHLAPTPLRPRSGSASSAPRSPTDDRPGRARRLSHRLGLSRPPAASDLVPDLPAIVVGDQEAQWEARATLLADTVRLRSRPGSPTSPAAPAPSPSTSRFGPPPPEPGAGYARASLAGDEGEERAAREARAGLVSTKLIDDDIQQAIRLHEQGALEVSTKMFGRLADPRGANNPLSQVLYGLALRHGWGCTADPAGAVKYLTAAAGNAATIEQMALQAGLSKGGAAKGELVLAIFELANCFRNGWGIERDAVAAKQYYETAANLGDTDAMNEVAWCYLEGFGCKKDKTPIHQFEAARYYRLAETKGSKTLGNSWIWKDKYSPENRRK